MHMRYKHTQTHIKMHLTYLNTLLSSTKGGGWFIDILWEVCKISDVDQDEQDFPMEYEFVCFHLSYDRLK